MNKWIFLDIDGVMVTDFKDYNLGKERHNLDKECIHNLNTIVENTDADIIISSTWRFRFNTEDFQQVFFEDGFLYPEKIIDINPRLTIKQKDYNFIPRGLEIENWIRNKTDSYLTTQYKYVIVDDDNDMLLWHKDNFICVDTRKGLKDIIAVKQIIALLKTSNLVKV